MSVGLPLLLSDIPSHNEVIDNSINQIGLIFDHNNENDFINKLDTLISIKRDLLSFNVQTEFTQKYTANIMAKNHELAYFKLLNR